MLGRRRNVDDDEATVASLRLEWLAKPTRIKVTPQRLVCWLPDGAFKTDFHARSRNLTLEDERAQSRSFDEFSGFPLHSRAAFNFEEEEPQEGGVTEIIALASSVSRLTSGSGRRHRIVSYELTLGTQRTGDETRRD